MERTGVLIKKERGIVMTTEERIEKLEAELIETKTGLTAAKRLTRRLMAGAGVVMGMFALFVAVRAITGVAQSQTGDSNKIITAKEFRVVDDQGKKRAVLAMAKDGPHLDLCDENGRSRAVLSTSKYEPGLTLYDKTGKRSAELKAPGGGAGLILSGEYGQGDIRMFVLMNGPEINLIDVNDKLRATLTVWENSPGLYLYDKNGKTRAGLGAIQTDSKDGRTITYPESSLLLFGPDGKVIWQAP